jgi:hypothetical protein
VGAKAISPNAAKPKRKYLFISGFPELDGNEKYFMLLLGTGQVTPWRLPKLREFSSSIQPATAEMNSTPMATMALAALTLTVAMSMEGLAPFVFRELQEGL